MMHIINYSSGCIGDDSCGENNRLYDVLDCSGDDNRAAY